MTEEFIPRDIPIYCLCDENDEKQKLKFIETRNSWVKRFGFTNFKMQRKLRLEENAVEKFEEFEKILFKRSENQEKFNNYITKKLAYNIIDHMILAKKLKNKKTHSIVINYHSVLVKDIPIDFMSKDVCCFSLDNTTQFKVFRENFHLLGTEINFNMNFSSGYMLSPKFFKYFYNEFFNGTNYNPEKVKITNFNASVNRAINYIYNVNSNDVRKSLMNQTNLFDLQELSYDEYYIN